MVGGANYDFTARAKRLPRVGETLLAYHLDEQPGGKGANQAVAAALWGAPTTLLAHVGEDVFGDLILSSLRSAGVDTEFIVRDAAGSGLGLVFMAEDGSYQTLVAPRSNYRLSISDLEAIEPRWAEVGVLLLQFESPGEVVLEAAKRAHRNRIPVVFNAAPAEDIPSALWPYLTYLIVNENEAAVLSGCPVVDRDSACKALSILLKHVPSVVITLGANGVLAQERHSAPLVLDGLAVPVANTLGAGDAFIGVFAAELACGQNLQRALTNANRAAAFSVTRAGAQSSYGTPQQVETFFQRLHKKSTERIV